MNRMREIVTRTSNLEISTGKPSGAPYARIVVTNMPATKIPRVLRSRTAPLCHVLCIVIVAGSLITVTAAQCIT